MSSDLAHCLERIAKHRDEDAFSELFREVAPRIKHYMMRSGVDTGTADELAQEALARVWIKAGGYSAEKGNPTTWIFTIARNLRIDRLRKERVWSELPEGHEEQPSGDPGPDEQVSENELISNVRDALKHLPPDQYEVITLSYIEGLPHSTISKRLNVPLGTIKSRLRLAYEKLRPILEGL